MNVEVTLDGNMNDGKGCCRMTVAQDDIAPDQVFIGISSIGKPEGPRELAAVLFNRQELIDVLALMETLDYHRKVRVGEE